MSNTKVDAYIEKQPSPQKEVLLSLRTLIHKTLPDIREEFKLGVPVYDDRYYLVALKDKVHFGFSIVGMSEKEVANFQGNGKTTRNIPIYSVEDIDEKQLIKLVKLVKKPYT